MIRRALADLALYCARKLNRIANALTDLAFRIDPSLMGRA